MLNAGPTPATSLLQSSFSNPNLSKVPPQAVHGSAPTVKTVSACGRKHFQTPLLRSGDCRLVYDRPLPARCAAGIGTKEHAWNWYW